MTVATAYAATDDVLDDASPEALVHRAITGDRRAWEGLVDLYSGLVWAVTRQFRLCDADAADVTQTTWLRLLEHIDRLNDASRVGAWLATTARRECLRAVAHRKRVVLVGDERELESENWQGDEVDASLLAAERAEHVTVALAQLPKRWRDVMLLLSADPPTSYEEISAKLDVPIGSIGPTRRRCLRRLHGMLGA
jgi:RNA polymerase sigma factor (sigma-70 family)